VLFIMNPFCLFEKKSVLDTLLIILINLRLGLELLKMWKIASKSTPNRKSIKVGIWMGKGYNYTGENEKKKIVGQQDD